MKAKPPLVSSCVRLKDTLIDSSVRPRIVVSSKVVMIFDGLQIHPINLFVSLVMELEVCTDKSERNLQETMVCIYNGNTSSLTCFGKHSGRKHYQTHCFCKNPYL